MSGIIATIDVRRESSASAASMTTNESLSISNSPFDDMMSAADESTPGMLLSATIIEAQREADLEVDEIERNDTEVVDRPDELPAVPRLLGNLNHEELIKKTKDMKSKNQQLDLLLLKAESYSHFISENQRRSRESFLNRNQSPMAEVVSPESKGDKKRSSSSKSSKASKVHKTETESSPSSASALHQHDGSIPQPKSLVGGKLFEYQLEGMQWLVSLWENGLSGILADEMGLGKTIQIIALIAYLREHNTPGPYLIAAPLATLPNWIKEFQKWLPSCPIVLYHGTKAERDMIRHQHMPPHKSKDMSFPIVITSFEICMIDRSYLEKYSWQYLILDEGHRIKNKDCKLLRSLKTFKSCSRLLLSGTPIQNSLEELWSLLNFVSPMIFDDLRIFQSWFGFKNIGIEMKVEDIVDTEYTNRIVSKLHEILRPFLLRRLKKDMDINIPPKREIIVYCSKTSIQKEYYYHTLNNTLRESLLSMGVSDLRTMSQLNMNMNLRKICNHPFLFGEPRDVKTGEYLSDQESSYLIHASGKFQVLDRMLMKLKQDRKNPHKVLIFSQMTELLNILEDFATMRGYRFVRFDGSTKVQDRQIAIEEFNSNPEVFIFFISTRAGGLGINLTSADTVILFDSDYNPHQDSQAQDRCHRIGQTKPVVIYRLITTNSVEVSLLEKQVSKKKLERLTIHGGDYRKAGQRMGANLSLSKLRQLLQDDVKNLKSRLESDQPSYFNDVSSSDDHINDEELDLILDRCKLFAEEENASNQDEDKMLVPAEGRMYDIVHSNAINILQSVK